MRYTPNEVTFHKVDDGLPEPGHRVLCYSPGYEASPQDNSLLWRVMDSQFVRISGEITYWAYLSASEIGAV